MLGTTWAVSRLPQVLFTNSRLQRCLGSLLAEIQPTPGFRLILLASVSDALRHPDLHHSLPTVSFTTQAWARQGFAGSHGNSRSSFPENKLSKIRTHTL